MTAAATEGRVPFAGHSTWFQVSGDLRSRPPLLVLHGGPGDTCEALAPYDVLSVAGRQVVRHDQIGCGRSSLRAVAHDPAMWQIPLFVAEIDNLREHLGLDEVHLLGQSWGGMLAIEYALSGATGIRSLTLQSTLASIEEWTAEARRLLTALPTDMQAAMAAHERGEPHPAFAAAVAEYERRYIMRLADPPQCWRRRTELVAMDTEVYEFMVGGSEVGPRPGSPIADWDRRPQLAEITLPTLLLSGRHDCATPRVMRTLRDGIGGSEWHILENSSHSCQLEEPERALVLVADFLARVDAGRLPPVAA